MTPRVTPLTCSSCGRCGTMPASAASTASGLMTSWIRYGWVDNIRFWARALFQRHTQATIAATSAVASTQHPTLRGRLPSMTTCCASSINIIASGAALLLLLLLLCATDLPILLPSNPYTHPPTGLTHHPPTQGPPRPAAGVHLLWKPRHPAAADSAVCHLAQQHHGAGAIGGGAVGTGLDSTNTFMGPGSAVPAHLGFWCLN